MSTGLHHTVGLLRGYEDIPQHRKWFGPSDNGFFFDSQENIANQNTYVALAGCVFTQLKNGMT
jgi:hypothetical protein